MEHIRAQGGFTMVELIITIIIIGILTGIVVFTPKTFLITARDKERNDDTYAIARRLEQAYTSQDLGSPSYPSTAELAADIAGNQSRTMTRMQPEALRAPNESTKSLIGATSNSTSSPNGAGTPTTAQYIYQPLTASGSLCTANPSTSSPCVRYFLYFRLETGNALKTIKSTHQQ